MGKVWMTGGGSGGAGSDECTAAAGDVLKGKTYIGSDTDDEVGTGTLELTGTAADSQVLSGQTYYNTDAKTKRTGSMANRGAVNQALNAGGSYTIPAGYHNGSGKVIANGLAGQTPGTAAAANILSGKTAWVNGSKVTGNMANIGAIDPAKSVSLSSGVLYARMSPGAHTTNASSGYPEVSVPQATLASGIGLTAAKLAKGQTVLGIAGTYTSDANATAAYIYKGKTAYVNGSKITGSMTVSSVVSFSLAATSYNSVTATWKWPSKGPYSGVIIRYKTGSYPSSVTDGTQGYKGTGTASGLNASSSATISGLTQGTKYYFRIWVYCTCSAGDMYSGYKEAAVTTKPRGQQTFISSGTFTVPSGVTKIDVFAVGGGGCGQNGTTGRNYEGGRGGCSGYTATKKSISVSAGRQYAVTVGAGGKYSSYSGGSFSVSTPGSSSFGSILTAQFGDPTSDKLSSSNWFGGSGGGAGGTESRTGQAGGSNGSDGVNGYDGGNGQGTTTRAFGESNNTLYAGGGGGGAGTQGGTGAGGAGGGGNGAGQGGTGANGSAGTGSGGGGGGYRSSSTCFGGNGGSGCVIVRWGY